MNQARATRNVYTAQSERPPENGSVLASRRLNNAFGTVPAGCMEHAGTTQQCESGTRAFGPVSLWARSYTTRPRRSNDWRSAADLTPEVARVFADLINGPLARTPLERSAPTGSDPAAFAHNLPRVAASWDQPQLRRAGRHTAPQGRRRFGPPDPTSTPTSSASAQPLALG